MNVKLLRKVKKHILEEPKRLDMDTLGSKRTGEDAPACQTAACIAGWTCVLEHGLESVSFNAGSGWLRVNGNADLWNMGRDLLGLNTFQANALFREPKNARDDYSGRYGWPEKFSNKYLSAKTAKQRAKVAAARIEHFIKTKGRE